MRGLGLGLGWEVQHVSAAGSINLGKRHQEHVEDDDSPPVVGQLLQPEEGLGLVEQGEGQLVKLWLNRQLLVQQGWEGLVRLLGQLHQLWLDWGEQLEQLRGICQGWRQQLAQLHQTFL